MYATIKEEKRRMIEEGRAEGIATLVCRQARRKFGSDTAKHLSKLLEGVSDPDRIEQIGDWILDCEDAADLLARAREV